MPHSVTKYIQIERPAADAYAFLAEPATMPRWGIVHQAPGERTLGTGDAAGQRLPCSPLPEAHGILDHDFIDASEGFWSVTARVVPIGTSASVYMITLTKPDGMPVDAFDRGMDLMDDEIAALKACIEAL